MSDFSPWGNPAALTRPFEVTSRGQGGRGTVWIASLGAVLYAHHRPANYVTHILNLQANWTTLSLCWTQTARSSYLISSEVTAVMWRAWCVCVCAVMDVCCFYIKRSFPVSQIWCGLKVKRRVDAKFRDGDVNLLVCLLVVGYWMDRYSWSPETVTKMIGRTAMKFCLPFRMNCKHFGDPLTFHVMPSLGQNCYYFKSMTVSQL